MPEEDRIATFRRKWDENLDLSSDFPHAREGLTTRLTDLLSRLNQEWYSADEVISFTEEVESTLSTMDTSRLNRSTDVSLSTFQTNLRNAVESDLDRDFDATDLEEVLRDNIDSDSMQETIEGEFDYNWHNIKSSLYSDAVSIARREDKQALDICALEEDIRDLKDELESKSVISRYRNNLIEPIEDFLTGSEPRYHIDEVIPELIGELLSVGWPKGTIEELIEIIDEPDRITEFCEVLREEKYERQYCVPLPADRIQPAHIRVAGVDFYMEESDEFTYIDELLDADERVQQHVELATQDTSFFAVLSVTAPTQEVGEQYMKSALEKAIDALNFSKTKGVIRSPFTQPKRTYFSRNPSGVYQIKTYNHHKFSIPHEFQFEQDSVDLLENWFVFFANGGGDLTELERRFIRSYRWYGDGIQSGVNEDELLKYIISIENMLVPERFGRKKHDLAQRLADLFGIYEEYRDSFKDEIASLYNTRNALVHSAEIDLPNIDEQVSSAHRLSTDMFNIILTDFIEDHEDIEQLLEDLEDSEVPSAPEDHNPFRF